MLKDYLAGCFCSIFKKKTWIFSGIIFFKSLYFLHPAKPAKNSPQERPLPAIIIDIRVQVKIFNDSVARMFKVLLCADMPNNIKILQMANHRETEHGFVIFQKINPAIDTIRGSLVFIQSRIAIRVFKNSKGRIKDISH